MATELRDYIAGLPEALPEEISASDGVGMAVVGGVAKKVYYNKIAPRVQEMNKIDQLVGTELLRCITEEGAGGLEGLIAMKELQRIYTAGVISPLMPQYGCKFDTRETKSAQTTSGSNVIVNGESMHHPSDVGKQCFISNGGPSFAPLETTITEYLSPTQVRIATNASVNKADNQMFWGTDDTAGLALAREACRAPGTYSYGGCLLLPVGMGLTAPLTYSRGMAITGFGPRQSALVRKPTSATTSLLRQENNMVDFPCLHNFGLYGAQYIQRSGFGSKGLEYKVVDGTVNMPQVDPYPIISHMHIWGNSWHGMETAGRFSGSIICIEVIDNWGDGWLSNSYDANVMNVLAIGNRNNGVNFDSNGSANCNVDNLKSSYNGFNGSNYSNSANLRIAGTGHNLANMRLQESWGPNLVIDGSWNKIFASALDDTGCVKPHHSQGNTVLTIRPAVYLRLNTSVDNHLQLFVGRSVHGGNDYLTHALFLSGDASKNTGDIRVRDGTTYGNYAPGSGSYAPGAVGTDSSGGIGASNSGIKINGTPII